MLKWGLNIAGSLIVLVALIGCQKKDDFANIDVIGHAGNGLDNANTFYHDNSIESIEMALSTDGCDGIEVDVQLSSDNTLWLYHDDKLEFETNAEGCIAEQNDAYLESVTYSTIHKEKLAKLSDISDSYLIGRTIYIDVRHVNVCAGSEVDQSVYLQAMNAFRIAHPSLLDIVIITGSMNWLNAFKAEGYTVMAQSISMDHYLEITTSFPQLDGVVAANGDISKEDVSLIHADGRSIIIFDIRSTQATRKAFKKLPDALMTDNLRNAIIEKY